jgi:trans-aconitate methyltransferase
MDHEEVGRYWDANAEAWTELVRAGYDHYRDGLNTPAFLEMLPDVEGLAGLDVGCGEGHNTRLVAERGAH